MKIGALAKLSGCSVQAIRHYEKEGLIEASVRSEGNFRLYDQEAVSRLTFIKRCRTLDLSLPEVKELLQLTNKPKTRCDTVNRMVETHIAHVEERIAELTGLREQLCKLRSNCSDNRMVEECGIIKNLVQKE